MKFKQEPLYTMKEAQMTEMIKWQQQTVENQRKALSAMWDKWKEDAGRSITKYFELLKCWQKQYEPKSDDEEYHPRFLESCQEFGFTEYLYNRTIQADEKEWQELYRTNKNEINEIKKRVEFYEWCKEDVFPKWYLLTEIRYRR